MAEKHPLALSLPAKIKRSPAGTVTVASAPPEQRQAVVEMERARRRHMSRLYAELGALLPDRPPRANRTQILDEAIAYVGALQCTVSKLEAHGAFAGSARHTAAVGGGAGAAVKASCFAARLPAVRRTAADGGGAGSGAAEVLAAGKASYFAARLPVARRPGSLTRMLEVFRRHGVPVLAATVTSNGGWAAVTVTTAAVAPSVVEEIKADISSSIA